MPLNCKGGPMDGAEFSGTVDEHGSIREGICRRKYLDHPDGSLWAWEWGWVGHEAIVEYELRDGILYHLKTSKA